MIKKKSRTERKGKPIFGSDYRRNVKQNCLHKSAPLPIYSLPTRFVFAAQYQSITGQIALKVWIIICYFDHFEPH